MADRPRLVLQLRDGGSALVGELRSMGVDILTLAPEGETPPAYVRLASISEISLFDSG